MVIFFQQTITMTKEKFHTFLQVIYNPLSSGCALTKNCHDSTCCGTWCCSPHRVSSPCRPMKFSEKEGNGGWSSRHNSWHNLLCWWLGRYCHLAVESLSCCRQIYKRERHAKESSVSLWLAHVLELPWEFNHLVLACICNGTVLFSHPASTHSVLSCQTWWAPSGPSFCHVNRAWWAPTGPSFH